ncbi:MAG: phosphoribosylaminoimidazolesuccinocarboxamide synthase [Deltaproteobacteria bacterium]|nr:phosphoribosylaminoimidazolesuccinocarboxamide synthase [Deltaproteobacteria bacterium]
MIENEVLAAQLSHTIVTTDFAKLGTKYKGKVRDCYIADGQRYVVVTDRISAFDVVLGTIPFKGQVLNEIAQHWFTLTRDLVPNHVLSVPDPNVMVGVECVPLQLEFVMRAYLTGTTKTSIWVHYEQGAREFCGFKLPDGMRKNQPLAQPILTPSTKAAQGGHDESVSRQVLFERGVISEEEFDHAATLCTRLFAFGQAEARRRGLILVDTKYEIGRKPDGSLCFIDEIHTPDSSRYWFADDFDERLARSEPPRALDKDFVRSSFVSQGYQGDGPPPPLTDDVRIEAARRYISLFEIVAGKPFIPNTEEPNARMRRNLGI